MKTKFFNYLFPMAAAVIGLTSAASTSSIGRSTTAPIMGYKQIENENVCERVQECNNNAGFACTASSDNSQLYEYSNGTCLVPLQRDTPN
ncbi:hypothetical protein RT99_14040 [Flavobacterium sp. MEB061]|jgi:hypothetical protein|uniref:hypothetical protein n=1 Tax=Flavobacterium sp. MEB061 TaxID=1587524 RepID=UPI0005ACDD85|nr:hypothetical protein [Flavobacterium sp. MEB061]KIQ20189.1 hypothetical protein RT99_14040 [Flavobacterium sp. MEB061]